MKRLLKSFFITLGILVLASAFVLSGVGIYYYRIVHPGTHKLQVSVRPGKLGRWVDPFIGTGGFPWVCAYNFPGVETPFGMVRLGPETASIILNKKALSTSGYYYGDNKIIGFSHTRLNGTGATDGGHFLVVPAIGDQCQQRYRQGKYVKFSHAQEIAFPGYYAVMLPKPGVLVELTSTPRVGVHRYTFRKNKVPHILIDVSHALGDGRSKDGKVRILPAADEVEGTVRTFGTFASRYGGIQVYFVARFNRPFAAFSTWSGDNSYPGKTTAQGDKIGVDLSFKKEAKQVVEIRLAISYISIENARLNLEKEAAEKTFDEIVTKAKAAWEEKLGLVEIEGGTARQKRIFYTALYRTFQMPTVFNDVNGDYLGFDKKVHRAKNFRYLTDMSLWDTFRTAHPLYTLIAPKDQRDMLRSLVKMRKQGGWLPRWPSGNGYTGSMLGSPADIVIAGSYLKGIRDFDVEAAYQSMRSVATGPTPRGAAFPGRRGIAPYLKYHYCPSELMDDAVARTLEYAYADHAVARLANALGHEDDAKLFAGHSQFFKNLWNPETQYFQPRDSHGNFFEPFKPLLLTYFDKGEKYTDDYVEGDALQWRWAVFFDAKGLISLFKDRNYFVDELDDFFAKTNSKLGWWKPSKYYWHGNQPDIHAAYLFNDAGRPDLTQKWVRWIMEKKYGDNFIGLDGNDDGGTLSAWYVFSALGLYPVAGSDIYQIGSPLFKKAVINVGGRQLIIIAKNNSPQNIYVQKVWLNDALLDRSWLKHSEIVKGGVLRFEMGAQPL